MGIMAGRKADTESETERLFGIEAMKHGSFGFR